MNPYLVTATDNAGKRDSFVRQAASPEHLRSQLQREGFRDIELLDDEYSARLRGQRNDEARDDSPAAARREAQLRRGQAPGSAWRLAIRNNVLLIGLSLALAAWGWWRGRYLPLAIGVGALLFWVGFVRRGLGKADDYNDLLRAQARGDTAETARLIAKMSADASLSSNALLQSDLVFRRASLKAKGGNLAGALSDVQVLRLRPESEKGAFQSRVASLYYVAGDMPGYLHEMEESFVASGQAPSQRLDLAFGHARVGDAARARELLAALDARSMPPFHLPLVAAAEGVLLERDAQVEAGLLKLREAPATLEPFAGNPAFWPFQGIVVARLAAAFARAGRRAEAQAALAPWREVALNCTDPDTRRILETEVTD